MIRQLNISNYALISSLELQPCAGLNIITGETGAGKSIMMGALGLLRGNRVDSKSLGSRDKKSVVEATFDITPDVAPGIGNVMKEFDIPPTADSTLRLTREIAPSGRSKAMANGCPVPMAALERLSSLLIDIHSQHQNLLLADSAFQLQTIDYMASNSALLAEYKEIYARYRQALKKYADTREEIARTSTDSDYLEYQLSEFTTLDLHEGEEEELEQQRECLANSAEMSAHLADAASILTWADVTATDQLRQALGSIRSAASINEEYAPLATRLETLASELDDIADTISAEASSLRDDPAMLSQVEQRLSRIYALKSKHRADSFESLLRNRDSIAERLAALADSDNLLHKLESDARALKRQALGKATELSDRRKDAATALAAAFMERARPLGMPNMTAEISITTGKLNPDGIDTVEFLFAFNKNQTPAPVARHASGGEISRVMLALKSITAAHRHLPTIIFDEIDTGVSGEVARRMGLLMAEIARFMQVVTITHLPQVAALGERHFKVFKLDEAESTHTHISQLTPDQRREEIAIMLSGNPASPEARAAADSLLKNT